MLSRIQQIERYVCYVNFRNMLSFSLCSTHLEILWLPNETLHVVSRASTLARLLYTAPLPGTLRCQNPHNGIFIHGCDHLHRHGPLSQGRPACCRLLELFTCSSYLFPAIGHSSSRFQGPSA